MKRCPFQKESCDGDVCELWDDTNGMCGIRTLAISQARIAEHRPLSLIDLILAIVAFFFILMLFGSFFSGLIFYGL